MITKDELLTVIRKAVTDVIKSEPQLIFESSNDRLNQKQAAAWLGITQSTVIRWKKHGLVPYEQVKGSTKIFYYKSQLKYVIQKSPKLLQAARN